MSKNENKTTNDLRQILFDEMEDLRNGNSTPNQATAVSKLATNIINSASLEISVAKVIQIANGDSNPPDGVSAMKLVEQG